MLRICGFPTSICIQNDLVLLFYVLLLLLTVAKGVITPCCCHCQSFTFCLFALVTTADVACILPSTPVVANSCFCE